ncbi:NAD(P)-binding protein [Fistulina hepatica ATCC 64428]|nr:NAD(P)-binding protein [Fistulina hepatica ATCC 64428]
MSSLARIFLTGATGYIGGTILTRLLQRSDAKTFHISVLVRDAAKAEKLKSFGVDPVVGSLSDLDIIEAQAALADIVIATADCDDVEAARATLRGLKKRFDLTGKMPIYLNTSGTGKCVLAHNADGKFQEGYTIYDDSDAEQIEGLPITQIHRPVDVAITEADKEGYIKSYIVLPATIYGLTRGPLVNTHIQNHRSVAVPFLLKNALDRGRAGMIGPGTAIWPHVHIDELADLYMFVFDGARAGSIGHGREGYYFGANGEYSWFQLAQAIGKAVVAAGRAEDPEPVSFTEEEISKCPASL